MFLGYQNEKIKFYTEQPLNSYIYCLDKIEETEDEYVLDGDEYVLKDEEWEEEQVAKRREDFENKFLELDENKNYRLIPEGYANAQQSIDTVNNNVNIIGSVNEEIAGMVIFYETPDFTKEEQCTEEWLIQHQFHIEPMTKEEWNLFYLDFSRKYAQKMYKKNLSSK